jgi:hypothetical protein
MICRCLPPRRTGRGPAAGPIRCARRLSELKPDEMTPREALEALYRLKAIKPE